MIGYKTVIVAFYQENQFTSRAYSVQMFREFGAYEKRPLDIINGVSIEVPEENADELILALRQIPGIKYAHEAVPTFGLGFGDVCDAYDTMYYGLNYMPEYIPEKIPAKVSRMSPVELIPWGISHIKAEKVHETGNRGAGVKIGVIDSGIDYNHQDLSGNYKGGYNYIQDNNDPFDECGHGTHVSATIAAKGRIIGVAPEANVYMIKIFNNKCSGNTADLISAIDWCVSNGIHIISFSGGTSADDPAVHEACDRANNAGILFIAAAGNAGAPGQPCNKGTIGWPAKYSSVVAVTAINAYNDIAWFSSRGPEAEIAAPGQWVYSAFSRAWGPSGLKYRTWEGTSMACPHVAGVAALVWAANPVFTNQIVRERLRNGCYPYGDSNCHGHGIIDAYAAVNGQIGTVPPAAPTTSHKACLHPNDGSATFCTQVYGSAFADECTENCFSCDRTDVFQKCIVDPMGQFKTSHDCTWDPGNCRGYSFNECKEVAGVKKCMPAHPGGPGAIPIEQCKQTCGACPSVNCNFSAMV